jgi:hypothetical protein
MPWHGISSLFMELPYWICFRWYVFSSGLALLGSFLVSLSVLSAVFVLVLTLSLIVAFFTHTSMSMSFNPGPNPLSVTFYTIIDYQAIISGVLGPSCRLGSSNVSKPQYVFSK